MQSFQMTGLFARRMAAIEERNRLHRCIVPIVDCIRKMRLEGVADVGFEQFFRTRPNSRFRIVANFSPNNSTGPYLIGPHGLQFEL